jgi:hypothetical protein
MAGPLQFVAAAPGPAVGALRSRAFGRRRG